MTDQQHIRDVQRAYREGAPASPIATQETARATKLIDDALGTHDMRREWKDRLAAAVAEALSSAERRNEELVGRAVDAENRLSDQIRVANEALAICALWKERADEAERRNEELVRALEVADEQADRWSGVANREIALRQAAESALAPLTGQVGEMRGRAAKVADAVADYYASQAAASSGEMASLARAIETTIRVTIPPRIRALAPSPPGISTTGGDGASGREADAALATTPAPTLDGAERR